MPDYSKFVPVPSFSSINQGLSPAHQQTMLDIFGRPGALTKDCSDITNASLQKLMDTENVGPFKVTGLRLLLGELTEIFDQVRQQNSELYKQVGTEGMLCCRAVHGSTNFSNHSWGSAVDIRFAGKSDEVGDGMTEAGLLALYPYFHVRGWYWGAGFGNPNPKREDSMHFEASDELIRRLYGSPLEGDLIPDAKLKAAGIAGAEFSIDTNLKTTKSPLTAKKIEDYFDKRKKPGLKGIGDAVIAASEKYTINATYIVSHAILETGWGTSKIYKEKNNLFGWSAFDSSPYSSAKGFPSREECIDFVMGRVDTLYLSPTGKYFRKAPCVGNKLFGMNVEYAAEGDWGANIAIIGRHMEAAGG
jgi:mannosyl-glycoprotein endo-beta-N-acetylglucosaminidase/D-alanyl-D-alanine carboxypeptidase-like protein